MASDQTVTLKCDDCPAAVTLGTWALGDQGGMTAADARALGSSRGWKTVLQRATDTTRAALKDLCPTCAASRRAARAERDAERARSSSPSSTGTAG